jgi:hypothetical protein
LFSPKDWRITVTLVRNINIIYTLALHYSFFVSDHLEFYTIVELKI